MNSRPYKAYLSVEPPPTSTCVDILADMHKAEIDKWHKAQVDKWDETWPLRVPKMWPQEYNKCVKDETARRNKLRKTTTTTPTPEPSGTEPQGNIFEQIRLFIIGILGFIMGFFSPRETIS